MNRRGFLLGMGGILVAGAAPAIVRADSLMCIVPSDRMILHAASMKAGAPNARCMMGFDFENRRMDLIADLEDAEWISVPLNTPRLLAAAKSVWEDSE